MCLIIKSYHLIEFILSIIIHIYYCAKIHHCKFALSLAPHHPKFKSSPKAHHNYSLFITPTPYVPPMYHFYTTCYFHSRKLFSSHILLLHQP